MQKLYKYITALLFTMTFTLCWAGVTSSVCDNLESILSEREYYFNRQQELIEQQEAKLLQSNDKRKRFEICRDIFNLSRSYRYGIAYKYSNESLNLAREIGDDDLVCLAYASMLSTFTSGGLFTESADIIRLVNTTGVSDEVKREYFYNVVRYYSDQIDYTNESEYRDRYREKLVNYADSIIVLSKSPDYYFTYATAYKESTIGHPQKAVAALDSYYSDAECSEHHASIITFLLGVGYFELGDESNGFKYLERSIYHDVRAAARENRSIKTFAQHLFDRGELKVSEKLINIAFDDAKFYNARHRNLEINTLLPIINEQKIETISRQRNILYILLVVISLLGVCAVVAVVFARRSARIIYESRQTIEMQLKSLAEINSKLVESNSIKEHYVIESLYKKNEYMRQVEALLKKIDVKIKNRLYDDLRLIYKYFNIKKERENFFSDFDGAFLKLFPNFIEEYNSLFEPQDQIDVNLTTELPPEVRIFALMRLGITENERISQFLDLSINTIYTYKTKVKSRSIVSRDEFEERILKIKLS